MAAQTIIIETTFKIFDNCLECPNSIDLTKADRVDAMGNKVFDFNGGKLVVSKNRVKNIDGKLVVVDSDWIIKCTVDGYFLNGNIGCSRQILIDTKEIIK